MVWVGLKNLSSLPVVGFRILILYNKNVLTRFNAFAVEGVVASLRTGRNCVGSTALKLYA